VLAVKEAVRGKVNITVMAEVCARCCRAVGVKSNACLLDVAGTSERIVPLFACAGRRGISSRLLHADSVAT